MDFLFFLNSCLFGIALAMDAFSVSIANGIHEPTMSKSKTFLIPTIFAILQGVMPFIGWFCVHNLIELFKFLNQLIPWIALLLLSFLGIKMIIEGKKKDENTIISNTFWALIIQGIATSIDALSVGCTIAEYNLTEAFVFVLIIAVITFFICFVGVIIGKKFGNKFSNKAELIGGIILIAIGIEICLTNIL